MSGRDQPSGHPAHALAIRATFGTMSREEFAGTVAGLHQRFRDECSHLLAQRSKQMQEALAKEGKRLQQSLSPFLSTPLRSDAAEVGQILKESLNRILEETRGSEDPSGPSLSTGLFIAPSVRKTRDRELFHRGMLMLRSACGLPPKHEEPLVELQMSARGGTAAAALEDLLNGGNIFVSVAARLDRLQGRISPGDQPYASGESGVGKIGDGLPPGQDRQAIGDEVSAHGRFAQKLNALAVHFDGLAG